MTRTQPAGGVTTSWRPVWGGLLLVLLVVAVYQPVWNAGFVWDDDYHLTENPCVVGPLGLKEIWTQPVARLYPLTISSFWLQHALWGLNPLPYHLVNVGLHALCAVLLWRLLRRLQVPAAWFGAALWALHPVQVESVAWITELKNTQSGLFYLLTILFFLRWSGAGGELNSRPQERDYALSVLFAALAMASKPSTVVLPVVLGLCAWWTNGRWHWRDGLRLVPFFVLAGLVSADTIRWVWGDSGAQPLAGPERLLTAGRVVWFYVGKLIWPHPLMFIYPRWEIDATSVSTYWAILAVTVVGLVLWWNRQGRLRPVFFAFAYYLVVLLPVIGVVDQHFYRYSFVADHFQYLPGIGLVALAVATGHRFLPSPSVQRTLGILVLGIFSLLTWRQARVYHDVETLWRDTLAKNPACWLAHNNLGNLLRAAGRSEEAIHHLEMAIDLKPDVSEAYLNLGSTLTDQGRFAEAIVQYREGLRTRPTDPRAHYCLALALSEQGEVDEALVHYREALRFKPDYAAAHFSLARELMRRDALVEATIHYRAGLRLAPNNPQAHNNLGVMLARQGRLEEAIRHYREALRLQPGHRQAANNLKQALAIQQNSR